MGWAPFTDGVSGAPAHRQKDGGPEGSRLSFDESPAQKEAFLCLPLPTRLHCSSGGVWVKGPFSRWGGSVRSQLILSHREGRAGCMGGGCNPSKSQLLLQPGLEAGGVGVKPSRG